MKDIIINQYFSDDYAGLEFGKFKFYYGYEYGRDIHDDEVWGFYLQNEKKERLFQITKDEMENIKNCPKNDGCQSMLVFGIGIYLNKIGNRNS